MASNNIARLGVVLGLDMAEFTANINKAIQENKKFTREIKSDTDRSLVVLNELTNATNDYGKSVSKVTLMEREMAGGKLKFATQDRKDAILAQAAAYDAVVAAAAKQAEIAENAKLVAQQEQLATKQIQELKFATEDYGQTLTKVAQIQREVSSGKFSAFSDENKAKLLEQAAAYDKLAASAKHEAEVVAAAAQAKQQNQSALTELQNLKNATDDYGKTLTKVQIIEREITSGRLQGAGVDVKAQLLAQAAAYDQVAANAHKAAGGLTAWQKQGLAYQTTDFFTQIASGQNVMIAAIQQGGQLKDQMGGLGNMFKVLTPLIFSTTTALIATGGVIATFAYGLYQGNQELKELNRQLVLTGNYAGVTANSLYGMADSLSQMKGFGVGSTKEVMLELVKSGQYTSQTLESVSTAILNFSRISGVSAKDAADQLIPMFNGTAKGAFELTQKFNFLTLSQYKQIEALERQGKIQQAIQLTAELYNNDLAKQKGTIDDLASSWEKLGNFIEKAWKNIKTFADPKSKDVQIVSLVNEIASLQAQLESEVKFAGRPRVVESFNKLISDKQKQVDSLIEQSRIEADEFTRKQELAKQKDKIKRWKDGGGESSALAMAKKAMDAERELKYATLNTMADDELKIGYDSANKMEKLATDYYSDIQGKDAVFLSDRRRAYIAELQKEIVERDQKMDDYHQKAINKAVDAAQAERFARQKIEDEEAGKILERQGVYTNILDASIATANAEKDKLEAQIKTVGMSEKQVKLAEIEAKYQEDIARNILEAKGDPMALAAWNAKTEALKKVRVAIIEDADSLSYLKEINDTVWKDMTSALDEFVNTGSLNFSKLTQSIIQDLLKIQLKKQALALWETASGGGGVGGLISAGIKLLGFADGGSPPINQVSMVGERGPELFIPKTAGTIIPNNKLGDMGGTVNNITNYNIDAIDTKSFEDRILGSSKAVWAANAYGNKNLAVGRGRT